MPGMPVLDELMANAWPPAAVEMRDGWRFRWTNGVTRRANSALAAGSGDNIAALVADAEAFYQARSAPTLIQLSTASAPSALFSYLEQRGCSLKARTRVEQARTADVIARSHVGIHDVEVSESLTDDWFGTYWSVEATRGWTDADRSVLRDVLLAPQLPTVFAVVRRGPDVIGVGQAVIEQGWAGVQCMATSPADRRQGVAEAVLHVLAEGAFQRDATGMYLAVMADNPSAIRLYGRVGFARVHEYSYAARAVC